MEEERSRIVPSVDPGLDQDPDKMAVDPQAMTRRHEAEKGLEVLDSMDSSGGSKEEKVGLQMGRDDDGWRFNGPYDYPASGGNVPKAWKLEKMFEKAGPKALQKGLRHESLWSAASKGGVRSKYARYKHHKNTWIPMKARDRAQWNVKRTRYGKKSYEQEIGKLQGRDLHKVVAANRNPVIARTNPNENTARVL